MLKEVRLGVIGVGSMGSTHARSVQEGKIRGCRLAAVCDLDPRAMLPYPGAEAFTDSAALIRSGKVDAVVIATPHYFHTSIGIDALQQGLHVATEKPLSVSKLDCQRLIAAHQDPAQVFAVLFMYRGNPVFKTIRAMIQAGELGQLQRVHWTLTDWFRPDSYYKSGTWRATWKGEGGGLLVNQCPHDLDMWQWLFGMPQRLRASCHFGKWHPIEVEDEVTAYMEYASGLTGVFTASTGEAPGLNRLEIAGENGRLTLEHNRIHFVRNEVASSVSRRHSQNFYEAPPHSGSVVPAPGEGGSHAETIQNFVDAILHGAPLMAPGEEGLHAAELGNAMLYSSLTKQEVSLPLDAQAFEARLDTLRASGKP